MHQVHVEVVQSQAVEEAAAFLRSRRERITPERPGLRRGEVATPAGVSVECCTRLERGNLKGVSGSVLDVVAAALRLDDTERMHLYDRARAAGPAARARVRRREGASAG
ncbi:helix-turn-helix domain-containing protein [Kitasatospora sp. NPDC059795]|uniref:helix-turn-helix domain-containing protein n=1 Tax=Kitasatospora sp. NPDC059795 TaxID=3346949 RepID=UPI003652275D